jgi:hypothetical protein
VGACDSNGSPHGDWLSAVILSSSLYFGRVNVVALRRDIPIVGRLCIGGKHQFPFSVRLFQR